MTALPNEITRLESRADSAKLPEELTAKVADLLERLKRLSSDQYAVEYERTSHYVDWVVSLPWENRSDDRLDLTEAKTILDRNHYGLEEVKERVLQYLAALKLKTQKDAIHSLTHAPILCLVGLVGTGKTTLAYSLAEAMARTFVRIPFGGMGSVRDLRGQSRLHLEAEPGYVIKALRQVGVRNPVILLDEIDRVAEPAKADIMGALIELLDPEQNAAFVDHYLDYPFDLSEVLFVATANNTTNIATAVMDRLEIISMPAYTDEEKIMIGKHYLLPKALEAAGLTPEQLSIEENLWSQIVRPLGFDAGIRTLQRTLQGMTLKLAKEVVEKKRSSLHLTGENVKVYLPK